MSHAHPHSLAGATILQVVPSQRDDPAGHAAVDIALTLLQAGARPMVAGDGGPLVGELRAFGGEWLPMINDTFNPRRIRDNARTLANLIASERIDIMHAQSAGGAWSLVRLRGCGSPGHGAAGHYYGRRAAGKCAVPTPHAR